MIQGGVDYFTRSKEANEKAVGIINPGEK